MKKIFFAVLLFYFLAVLQTSFLAYFSIFGIVLNLVLLFAVVMIFFESAFKQTGYFIAFVAGFYSDVFSFGKLGFFGFYTLLFLTMAFVIKFFFNNYVRFSIIKK